ncbi:hypothetical protein OROHE_012683 [Orobanche hederae]
MANRDLASEDFIMQFHIPSYILDPNSEVECSLFKPECPVLVFINSRSGGQLGGDLLVTYRSLLDEKQVIDLGEEAPDTVLRKLFLNLERLKNNGDAIASELEKKLKIIVAGGDGTAGWLLGVVSDLKLSQPPPIATVPLGTGNNLPFAFGWGKKNPGTDRSSVISFLVEVQKAKEMKIDSWRKVVSHSVEDFGTTSAWEWMRRFLMPSTLRESYIQKNSKTSWSISELFYWDKSCIENGLFKWDLEEVLIMNTVHMQSLDVHKDGFLLPSSTLLQVNIAQLCRVKIMKGHGDWQELRIPHSIRSIVCLNLPSFSGGLNPWGTPNSNKRRDRELTPPFVDDGLLEIVGFRDAWHGLVLYAPNGHGRRLAQAHRIRFEFHKGAVDHTYMRIDGEPWKQPLPINDETVVVEISHLGQVKMLASHDCRSKSVLDPSSPIALDVDEGDSDNEDEPVGEEWRKFGAADTFRIPDDVDISNLS